MHPIAHKSDAGEERLSVRISGDTYCAVPTKLLRRAVPSLELSASIPGIDKYFKLMSACLCLNGIVS